MNGTPTPTSHKETTLPHSRPRLWQRLPACLFAFGLAACSASADLTQGSGHPAALQRFDQFQAAADNGRTLLAVGTNGLVVRSQDRGASWTRHEIDRDASARAALIGIAACADGSFGALDFFHRVWLADSHGENWRSQNIDEPGTPLAIACDSRNRLWVVGSDSTIASSADRGATWSKTTVGDDAMLASIQFVDAEHGFITGEFGSVFQTNDGGAHWHALPKIGADFYPYAAHFADGERGWVAGLAGVVMQTNDGGRTWKKEANPLGAPIYGLSVHNGTPVGVGVNGLVFRRQQGQWTLDSAHPTNYLRAALPLADGRLLLAGGSGMLGMAAAAAGTVPATH